VARKRSSKRRYRLRNWPDYNAALVRRGSLILWVDAAALAGWAGRGRSGQRGRPPIYSDLAITVLLTLKAVYHLTLRSTEGFATSLLAQLDGTLSVPDFSTLSRRARTLAVPLPVRPVTTPMHWAIDTTGLKIYGEGEWKVRQHGWTKHRRWLRLHLAVDTATGELRSLGASTNNVNDSEMLPAMLAAERAPLRQVTGDGMYDRWHCWDAVAARPERPRAVFPPPRTHRGVRCARIKQHGNRAAPPLDRDTAIRRIRAVGRAAWKREVGYHQRSLAETAVWRWRSFFGDHVHARTPDRQCTEVFICGAAFNRMTALGMPDSYPV
jgi:IS5 family transposase